MKSLLRTITSVGLLALAAAALPAPAARADAIPPIRRVSCPTITTLNSLLVRFGGEPVFTSRRATPTSCEYFDARSPEPEIPALAFAFTEFATPKEAEDHLRATWPEEAVYDFAPWPLPALGEGAFAWADASPSTIYWQLSPGAVGTMWGLWADEPVEVAVARTFKPMMEVYTIPGVRTVNGRQWRTTCEPYSATIRCRTDIVASVVKRLAPGKYRIVNDWTFNSLTYRWAPRSLWKNNPLATTGSWTGPDHRQWRTECDTSTTGVGACRTYIRATVLSQQHGKIRRYDTWVLNSQVLFDD